MYNISLSAPQSHPWDSPLLDRIAALRSASVNQYKIVVYLQSDFIDRSVFRYRAYNPCQTLENSRLWKGFYFWGSELPALYDLIDAIDHIILVRYGWDEEIHNFVQFAQRSAKKIFFDCDDLVFDVDYIQMLANTKGESLKSLQNIDHINGLFAYVSRYYAVAKHCNGYITTNAFLSGKFKPLFGKDAHVMRNYMNREQLEVSKICREQKEKQPPGNPFTIGYFSGTATHQIDLLEALPHIIELMHDQPDINLRVVGFMEFPSFCSSFLKEGRIEFRTPCDFRLLPAEIAAVDINIAPLVLNDFNHCKSELKFFEAAAVNTPTCASPSFTFKESIKNGKTGFLCQGNEWYYSLKKLYEERNNTKQEITHSARKHCLSFYSSDQMLTPLENLMETLSNE